MTMQKERLVILMPLVFVVKIVFLFIKFVRSLIEEDY